MENLKNKQDKILSDFRDAIDFFDKKQKFAKNKKFHNKNVNHLVKAYNLIELNFQSKLLILLEALMLEAFFKNLKLYEHHQIAIKQTVNMVQNPELVFLESKSYLTALINSGLFKKQELLSEEMLIKELNQSPKVANDLIQEIITKLKMAVKWS